MLRAGTGDPGGCWELRAGIRGQGLSRDLACSGEGGGGPEQRHSHRGSRTGGGHAPGRRALPPSQVLFREALFWKRETDAV